MKMITTSITITDTGKRRTTSSSAEETDVVNSGSSWTLRGVEITLSEGAILNTSPVVGKTVGDSSTAMYTHGEVDHLGIQLPKWTVRGILDFNNTTDQAAIQYLRELSRTKGYKELSGDLPDLIDGSDNGSVVNVRIKSVQITHRSNTSIIDYVITAIETA